MIAVLNHFTLLPITQSEIMSDGMETFKISICALFLQPSETSDIRWNTVKNHLVSGAYEHVAHCLSHLKPIYRQTVANAPKHSLLIGMASDMWKAAAEQYAVKSKRPSK
jgi:hypothetical protein